MSKHTPGPWIFEGRDGDHPLNDQNGWGCNGLWAVNGGFILGDGQGWDGTYQGPSEANARLIAAAPEMYELIERAGNIMIELESLLDTALLNDASVQKSQWHKDVAKLLAKIEGGQDIG